MSELPAEVTKRKQLQLCALQVKLISSKNCGGNGLFVKVASAAGN